VTPTNDSFKDDASLVSTQSSSEYEVGYVKQDRRQTRSNYRMTNKATAGLLPPYGRHFTPRVNALDSSTTAMTEGVVDTLVLVSLHIYDAWFLNFDAVEPGYINTSLSQPSEAMAILAVKALKRTCRVTDVSLD
jgi:hypothetical protein